MNARGAVVGHELLWGGQGDLDAVTVLEVLNRVGVDALVGDGLALLTLPAPYLTGDLRLRLDPARYVLQLARGLAVSRPVVDGLARLSGRGFRIAVPGPPAEDSAALLHLAWGVKLDLRECEMGVLPHVAGALEPFGLVLIAEHVQTPGQARSALAGGCGLAQGWFSPRAEVLRSAMLTAGAAGSLRLAALLARPDVPMSAVVRAVGEQPALAVRLLRLAGSVAVGRQRHQVRSLAGAVSLVGLAALERWVLMAALSEQAEMAPERLAELLVPARMCELLAPGRGLAPDEAFLVGLLASLAELLEGAVGEHLGSFGLSEDVRSAVEDDAGPLGELLGDVAGWLGGEPVDAPGGPGAFALAWGRAIGWSSGQASDLAA